ncbi:MAG: serine/threonine-protein kinase, partial [Planctomycetota bacterium]
MLVTCPACGRKAAVSEQTREVVCDCGRRFDPAARATVADPFLGRELAGYRIEEVIGSGGMGTVYKATQLSLGRPVAFKVLPPNVADDPQFVHRFHREAEVLASLSHSHVVQVIDRGEADGRYFIVMEYVEGTSLRELIRNGPVPAEEACRVISGLLGALEYAHVRGIVHRDIKPE